MSTEQWRKLIASLPKGLTIAQVARLLGRKYSQVSGRLRQFGYSPQNARKLAWTPAKRRKQAQRLFGASVDWNKVNWAKRNMEIIATFSRRGIKVTKQSVWAARKRYGK